MAKDENDLVLFEGWMILTFKVWKKSEKYLFLLLDVEIRKIFYFYAEIKFYQ
jgi:hypothetical protein